MTVLFIFIVIYVVSFRANYLWFQRAHSTSDDPKKKGRWQYADADAGNVFFTVFPVLNTIVAITNIFESPYLDSDQNNANKFFNIKK